MRIDTVLTDVRVFPLLEISREQLEQAAGGPIVSVERVDGGLTNTIHKVVLEDGETLGIKHYAGGKDWFETELTTLTLLHGTVPVPDVVHADAERMVIAYRWIDGITLHEFTDRGLNRWLWCHPSDVFRSPIAARPSPPASSRPSPASWSAPSTRRCAR